MIVKIMMAMMKEKSLIYLRKDLNAQNQLSTITFLQIRIHQVAILKKLTL